MPVVPDCGLPRTLDVPALVCCFDTPSPHNISLSLGLLDSVSDVGDPGDNPTEAEALQEANDVTGNMRAFLLSEVQWVGDELRFPTSEGPGRVGVGNQNVYLWNDEIQLPTFAIGGGQASGNGTELNWDDERDRLQFSFTRIFAKIGPPQARVCLEGFEQEHNGSLGELITRKWLSCEYPGVVDSIALPLPASGGWTYVRRPGVTGPDWRQSRFIGIHLWPLNQPAPPADWGDCCAQLPPP